MLRWVLLFSLALFLHETNQSLLGTLIGLDTFRSCPAPQDFPSSIPLTRTTFQNWADDIIIDGLWTATPSTPQDIVSIANWAALHAYKVRPSGFMHTWSPITVTPNTTCASTNVLLVKTTARLTGMQMVAQLPAPAVKVQTGASMQSLLTFLEQNGYGVLATPAPGDLSVGGVLAIDGHGTGVPAVGEVKPPNMTYGSLSNLILSFTAVVWDNSTLQYSLRTFTRSEPESKAFLAHLGRAFLTEVTLQVGTNYNLRCESTVDIPATELFAPPNATTSGLRTFASFLNSTGRAEAIWFPFTENPWLKVWTVSPTKPLLSRAVNSPFNYAFSDNIPEAVALLARDITNGAWYLAPLLGQTMYDASATGLLLTDSDDIWGPSKNLLLYVKPTTLRVTANGYAVITARSNVQNIINSVATFYKALLAEYQGRGQFPINGPMEIRATGLDLPGDLVGQPQAQAPSLSAIRPVEGHPELNCAVWFDFLTFPGAPHVNEFMTESESYFLNTIHDGVTAIVRPEWSKGWAFTTSSAWSNQTFLTSTLPDLFSSSSNSDGWDWVITTLKKYDPVNIFSNEFLDNVFAS